MGVSMLKPILHHKFRPSYRNRLFWSLQTHTTTEWVRLEGTCEDHLVQNLSSKQGQLLQFDQDHVQLGFVYLQG